MIFKSQNLLIKFLFVAVFVWSANDARATPLLIQEDEQEEQEKEEREESGDEFEEPEREEREVEETEIEERERDGRRVSLKEVIRFAKRHIPDLAEHIQMILEEEGDEDEVVEHLVDMGTEMIHGYEATVEGHGRRMGERFLELFQINVRLEMIMEEGGESRAADQSRLKKEIKKLVTKRYALELILEKAELNRLKSELEEFEAEVKQRDADREENIASQLEEILAELEERSEADREEGREEEGEEEEGEEEEGEEEEGDRGDEGSGDEAESDEEGDEEDGENEEDDDESGSPQIDYDSIRKI